MRSTQDHAPPATKKTSRPESSDEYRRGQGLAEFAIVLPVLFLVLAGIIQFGLIFWSQQTLTQVARDTGRWAATQLTCGSQSDIDAVAAEASDIAGNSTLFGYQGPWTGSSTDTASTDEVVVSWNEVVGTCPPSDNQDESWVVVTIDHQIPTFFPLVPGDGRLSTTAEFRMEPAPI